MVYLLTTFCLNRVQFDYYYPRTYSNFIHGKIIFKNYNNLMSNWNGTLLLTIINYFNRLINGVSCGARRGTAFLQVIKKIYKREGDVKH